MHLSKRTASDVRNWVLRRLAYRPTKDHTLPHTWREPHGWLPPWDPEHVRADAVLRVNRPVRFYVPGLPPMNLGG